MAKSSDQIKAEIESKFGFVPPFFAPAFDSPRLFESLWQQTLSAYIENPLPALFKEKLAALLARYCTVPYCLLCHSSALRPLGMRASELLKMLEQPPLGYEALSEKTRSLDVVRLTHWPEEGSELEESILYCSVAIYLGQDTEDCQSKLRALLPEELFDYLILYIAYNKAALTWAEAHPELNFKNDKRVLDHYEPLIGEDPELATFFANYQGRVAKQSDRRTQWLTQENSVLVAQERSLRLAIENEQNRLLKVFEHMPGSIVLLTGADHVFSFANSRYRETFLNGRDPIGKTLAEVLPESIAQGFGVMLDQVYKSGVRLIGTETPIEIRQSDGTCLNFYLNFVYEPVRNINNEIESILAAVTDVTDEVVQRRLLAEASAAALIEREKLELIIAASTTGLALLIGEDLVFEMVNDQFRKLVSDREYLNRRWRDVYSEIKNPSFEGSMRRVLASGEPCFLRESQVRVEVGPGILEDRYYDVSYNRISAGGVGQFRILIQCVDTTERVAARARIQATAVDLKDTLESMNDAFFSVGRDWRIKQINSQLILITGKTTDELIGMDIRELWFAGPELKKSQYWTQYHKTMIERIPTEFLDYYQPLDLWTQLRSFPKSDGGMAVFFADVGEAKRAERAVLTERRKLEFMITQAPIGIALLEGSPLRFALVNAEWEQFVFDKREYIGKTYQQAYPELESYGLAEIIDQVYKTGESYFAKEKLIPGATEDGRSEDRFFDFSFIRVTDSGGHPTGVFSMATNVTERILTQRNLSIAKIEAERANDLKSAFLANMSHEIRTPLGAMLGFADLLKDPGLSAIERSNFINILLRNGEQLSLIIDDILDLSKVESGHLTLEYTETDHKKIGSDVVSLMRVKAKEKDLVLDYAFDSSTPEIVIADPTRVRQILLNLVGNAIKFTQFGSVKIRAYGSIAEDGRRALYFEVSDTGIGISVAHQERLFQTFTQADETTTRKFGGTGLGLALSRRLARALGGDITIPRSEEGVGTTFLLRIADQPEKRSRPEDQFRPEQKVEVDLGEKVLEGLSILVVDDAPDNQNLIWRYLSKRGAVVSSAENGLLGYRMALEGNYDLVLMDIQMPVMDGYTATEKLRGAGYRKPIIALTAHAMNEIRKKALNVGYSDHLTKPINPSDLISTIVRYTKASRDE